MLHIEFLHERFEANLVTSIYKKVACNFLEPDNDMLAVNVIF